MSVVQIVTLGEARIHGARIIGGKREKKVSETKISLKQIAQVEILKLFRFETTESD